MPGITSFKLNSRLVLAVTLAGALATTTACSGDDGGDGGDKASGEKKYKIAYLAQGTTNSWAAQMDAIMDTVAKESGKVDDLLYFDAAGNAETQLGQLESALNQRPDAIILTPLGKSAAVGPVERAMAQDIPVILCASGVDSEDYTTQVAMNTYEASLAQAKWLVNDALGGKGTIAVVDGIAGVDTSEIMGKALREAVAEAPGVEIVQEGYGQFSVSDSKKLSQTFLASGKQIDAWWGSGGESVTGIMSALVDAKPAQMPPVAGATLSNGVLRMSLENDIPLGAMQFPATLAADCFEAAMDALAGEELPKFIDVTAKDGNENIYTEDVAKLYNEEYTDDYIIGSDSILSADQLAKLNLVR
ncbi:substrate-binding domain-containing protein [Nocardioides sp.]|uniref:substrate-binding domain-containing protein n=1 Tax=Nocardioides sp. TaxID=35761 RepID=UPI0025DB8CBE|nr:substrate-binding domain-containing protein [Nocardioides sp.]